MVITRQNKVQTVKPKTMETQTSTTEKESIGKAKKTDGVVSRRVTFKSEGMQLVGILRNPENRGNKKLPVIIVNPSWTNIKEQFAANYGEKLAALGYNTLCFDFRNYGESEGKVRNYEVPLDKVTDLKNAILFVEKQPEVDPEKIYMLGVCAGAGHTVMATVGNPEVKKLGLVASWLHDSEGVKIFYGGAEGVADRIAKSRAAKEKV